MSNTDTLGMSILYVSAVLVLTQNPLLHLFAQVSCTYNQPGYTSTDIDMQQVQVFQW
jgi:hypothetical protein